MESAIIFGNIITKYREKLGISQDDLAHRSKIDRSYVGRVERGERNPTINMLLKLASGLDVPASLLIQELEQKLGDINDSKA